MNLSVTTMQTVKFKYTEEILENKTALLQIFS